MKAEPFSFTPSTSGNTIILDDDTLEVKYILTQICKNGSNVNASTGYDTIAKKRAKYCLNDSIKDSGRTTAHSCYHKKDNGGSPAVVVQGRVASGGFSTPGEIVFEFDTADSSYTVDGLAVGE
jgi:hypothetical protein